LSAGVKCVAYTIAQYWQQDKPLAPSMSVLAEDTGLTKRFVIEAVQKLVKAGFLEVKKQKIGALRFISNVYELTGEPTGEPTGELTGEPTGEVSSPYKEQRTKNIYIYNSSLRSELSPENTSVFSTPKPPGVAAGEKLKPKKPKPDERIITLGENRLVKFTPSQFENFMETYQAIEQLILIVEKFDNSLAQKRKDPYVNHLAAIKNWVHSAVLEEIAKSRGEKGVPQSEIPDRLKAIGFFEAKEALRKSKETAQDQAKVGELL
jgi:hypothetical protein